MANACPSCGAPAVPNQRTCPSCGNTYSQEYVGIAETIPQVPADNPNPGADTMPCPMCSEPIPRTSMRCKWCGEDIKRPSAALGATPYQPQRQPPPQPNYGYMPPPPPPMPPSGTAVLVVGILSIVCCNILGPVAWIMGSNYEARCRSMGMEPDGAGSAGKIIGIIMTILLILSVVGFGAMVALSAAGSAAGSF